MTISIIPGVQDIPSHLSVDSTCWDHLSLYSAGWDHCKSIWTGTCSHTNHPPMFLWKHSYGGMWAGSMVTSALCSGEGLGSLPAPTLDAGVAARCNPVPRHSKPRGLLGHMDAHARGHIQTYDFWKCINLFFKGYPMILISFCLLYNISYGSCDEVKMCKN